MTDRSILMARLSEAETALHQLIVGKTTVQLSYQGESVTFSSADEGRLRLYISDLRAQLGLGGTSRTRARRVVFG
ncbi:gpW family head-tail joining protein [Pseudochrobactrum sp. MP213Fo]|uniref:gpW family head-tail joining protein n=1 Tax=Pseudochrobactrum sp. MP213Fo TaxID=3022250 RepID=UPI003BA2C2F8